MSFKFVIRVSRVAKENLFLNLKSSSHSGLLPIRRVVLPNGVFYQIKQTKTRNFGQIQKCHFHLTSPRNSLPAVFLLVLRFAGKAGAVISGRLIRKWWSKLPQNEKERIMENIRSRKTTIAALGFVFLGFAFLFYVGHIVEDPITKRKKFIMLNQKQINQIAEFEFNQQIRLFRSEIIPQYHPVYKRVARVTNTLILSNADLKEIRDKDWTVTVIDKPSITNAFALPHGKIFVFTGILNVCTNDDQLAIVLAHEIAHSILCHVAESMSKIFFVEFLLLVPTLLCWTIFPDAWAIFSEWITSSLTSIFIHLPFSRAIEKEADVVGLQLAARSCFDIREAPNFWQKMKILGADTPLEWLSTHPKHEKRQSELQEIIPEALRIRELNNCPPLKLVMMVAAALHRGLLFAWLLISDLASMGHGIIFHQYPELKKIILLCMNICQSCQREPCSLVQFNNKDMLELVQNSKYLF